MTKRHPEVLVAPTVTFLAIVALIGMARIYDSLPAQAPECGFRTTFGIPCPSCGGTRAFKALSHGHIREAIAFNPAVMIGVGAALVWFITGLTRFHRGHAPGTSTRRSPDAKKLGLVIPGIIALNWLYLILFLP